MTFAEVLSGHILLYQDFIPSLGFIVSCQNAQSWKTVSPRAVHCVLSTGYLLVPGPSRLARVLIAVSESQECLETVGYSQGRKPPN